MCKECVILSKQYLPELSFKERMDILWQFTCFPFGPVDTIKEQLIKFNVARFLNKSICSCCGKIKNRKSVDDADFCYKCLITWQLDSFQYRNSLSINN